MNRRIFLLSALGTATARGHDFYLIPARFHGEAPGRRRIGLHLGDGFPESEQPVGLGRVRNARAIGAAGVFPMEGLRVDGDRVEGEVDLPAEGTYVVAAETAPNAIELSAGKFETYLEHEGLRSVIRWRKENGESRKAGVERYTKFVKSLVAVGTPDGSYSRATGAPIEIVPEADPFSLKPGAELPIQVRLRGKAAPNLQIKASWARGETTGTEVAGRTDDEGRLTVPIGEAGWWRIRTVYMERSQAGDTDWESLWASLTFEVR